LTEKDCYGILKESIDGTKTSTTCPHCDGEGLQWYDFHSSFFISIPVFRR
jgi:hypothetical protein